MHTLHHCFLMFFVLSIVKRRATAVILISWTDDKPNCTMYSWLISEYTKNRFPHQPSSVYQIFLGTKGFLGSVNPGPGLLLILMLYCLVTLSVIFCGHDVNVLKAPKSSLGWFETCTTFSFGLCNFYRKSLVFCNFTIFVGWQLFLWIVFCV